MNTIHTSTGFTAPLTANSNLLEPNLHLGLYMFAAMVCGILLMSLVMRTLLNRAGVPVRVVSNDRRR